MPHPYRHPHKSVLYSLFFFIPSAESQKKSHIPLVIFCHKFVIYLWQNLYYGAGIGSGSMSNCGNITIEGGPESHGSTALHIKHKAVT